eukprot:366027-Chlamydomonas_euryale.AAC.5
MAAAAAAPGPGNFASVVASTRMATRVASTHVESPHHAARSGSRVRRGGSGLSHGGCGAGTGWDACRQYSRTRTSTPDSSARTGGVAPRWPQLPLPPPPLLPSPLVLAAARRTPPPHPQGGKCAGCWMGSHCRCRSSGTCVRDQSPAHHKGVWPDTFLDTSGAFLKASCTPSSSPLQAFLIPCNRPSLIPLMPLIPLIPCNRISLIPLIPGNRISLIPLIPCNRLPTCPSACPCMLPHA